nr:hypothetical protein [Tanacetum cinerariifolium]
MASFMTRYRSTVIQRVQLRSHAIRFGLENCDTVPTPMVEQAKLKLNLVGKPVDHNDYQIMIGSLMHVTSSRPDIMFATCMCARYQANPNEYHVSAVKRIFCYLKGVVISCRRSLALYKSKAISLSGRNDQEDVNAASKGVSAVSAAEPTVFDDEDVTMKMAQTLITLKAEKAKLLDEQIAQKLHGEEVQKATAREKQENADKERALELQRQYDDIEENINWSDIVEQNMAGYKMEYFIGMTYDKVRSIFKREYKKVQTLFKLDKDVEEPKKKRKADETLLQESFKKLRATEVSRSKSTQEIPSNDPKETTEEDLQNMLKLSQYLNLKLKLYRFLKIYSKDLIEKTLLLYGTWLKRSSVQQCPVEIMRKHYRGHDIFMLTEKDYPLSNAIMILMLSGKLQVEEDNEMARDLVMKIFIEANKLRSKTKDNVVQRLKENEQRKYCCWFNITVAGLILVMLDKVAAVAEVLKNLL